MGAYKDKEGSSVEKKTEDMNEQELLRELLSVQKKSARNSWIAMLAIVALTAILLTGLGMLLPRASRTLDAAYTTLSEGEVLLKQTEEMVDQAKRSLREVDVMVGSVNKLVEDNTEDLSEAMDKLNSLDIEKLNQSIEDLNAVIAPLAKLFGRG